MPPITEIQVYDVLAYTHGLDTHLGIDQFSFRKRIKGPSLAFRNEGELTPSSRVTIGTDEVPVSFSVTSRSENALRSLADAAAADVTLKVKQAGGTTQSLITMTAVEYEQVSGNFRRDAKGNFVLDGTALTLTSADAV